MFLFTKSFILIKLTQDLIPNEWVISKCLINLLNLDDHDMIDVSLFL